MGKALYAELRARQTDAIKLFMVCIVNAIVESDFISPTSEVRRLGRFWISGSLEAIESKALKEGDFGCRKATTLECGLALLIGVAAILWALPLF